MRVIVAIALLSVAAALPTPDVPTVDFRSLLTPKEVSQDDAGIAVNFVDAPLSEDGTAVNFVDSPINDDEGLAVKFIDSPVEDLADDGNVARMADNVESISEDENMVDAPVNEESDGLAVNFVDTPAEDIEGVAVRFVDNNEEAVAGDGAVSAFANMPINDDAIAVNFVDSPINEIFDDTAADIILIGNIFEPIGPSELETLHVDLPEDFYNVPYPAKTYDNPLLR